MHLNVALLTALGAVLLGTGQMGSHSVLLALLAVFAAITSVVFTDVLAWFRLNRTLANLAAIAAVGFSLTDFFGNDAEYQLLAVANLLIYLQVVLLYQEKSERIYWQLMILSLLQVVVSAALNLGFQFGVLIVAYMFLSFSAMGLFFLYRESLRFVKRQPDFGPAAPARQGAKGKSRRRRDRRRWPLRPTARPLAFRLKTDSAEIFSLRRFFRQVLAMGLTTLMFTVLFFFALPRVSNSVWQGPRGMNRAVVGFSQEVTLDTMSKMLQSEEEVMRVSFVDEETKESVQLMSGPYIRGTVLTRYFFGRGKWHQSKATQAHRFETLAQAGAWGNVVSQEIVLQPRPDPVLFAIYPLFNVQGTPIQVKIDPETRQLTRSNHHLAPRGPYRYAIGTTAFHNGRQLPLQPAGRYYRHGELVNLTRFQPTAWPNLKRIADEVVSAAGVADDDVYEKAMALEAHFHEPNLYIYSLSQLGVERAENLDPVEDFVANHRTGHCEYFASALVLMLRSQGIPARMVVGYRATEYNSVGDFYQVREKEAHAWVEAYLRDDQVPDELEQSAAVPPQGAWLRLDPTPMMDDLDRDTAAMNLWDYVTEWKNYVQGLWSDYVLGLNADRQKESIYAPVLNRLSSTLKSLRDVRKWPQAAAKTASWAFGGSMAGSIVTGALALFFTWLLWRKRQKLKWRPGRLARWMRPWRRRRRQPSAAVRRVRVDFYERLEGEFAKYGLRREYHQTQREFATSAVSRLAPQSDDDRTISLAHRIVEAFYRVRFGRRSLETHQTQEVEDALDQLSHALQGQGMDGSSHHSRVSGGEPRQKLGKLPGGRTH